MIGFQLFLVLLAKIEANTDNNSLCLCNFKEDTFGLNK